jgi:hypothetical protein
MGCWFSSRADKKDTRTAGTGSGSVGVISPSQTWSGAYEALLVE